MNMRFTTSRLSPYGCAIRYRVLAPVYAAITRMEAQHLPGYERRSFVRLPKSRLTGVLNLRQQLVRRENRIQDSQQKITIAHKRYDS